MNIIGVFISGFYACVLSELRAFRRLFKRLFRRVARLRWCSFFVVARSILETALRYAELAPSRLFSAISFSSFLMDERSEERWLMLFNRRLMFCRTLFLAWGELAKDHSPENRVLVKRVAEQPASVAKYGQFRPESQVSKQVVCQIIYLNHNNFRHHSSR